MYTTQASCTAPHTYIHTYAVPPLLDVRNWNETVSKREFLNWMELYNSGIVNGTIPRSDPPDPIPSNDFCLKNESWFAYTPDWDFSIPPLAPSATAVGHRSEGCGQHGALIKKCSSPSPGLPASKKRCFATNTSISLRNYPRLQFFEALVDRV